MIKLCCDCKHYQAYENWSSLDSCEHPSLPLRADVIRGEGLAHYCSEVRGSLGKCGPAGVLFEPHPDQVVDEDEPDRYELDEHDDATLDDPRHGQAEGLNKLR